MELGEDGSLESWDLSYLGLREVPESFGRIEMTGNLWLDYNQLRSLPESFSNMRVGGNLWLNSNQLQSLPESFGNIRVGGSLALGGNQLGSLTDFPNVNGVEGKELMLVTAPATTQSLQRIGLTQGSILQNIQEADATQVS